jgi:hypothetical protein
MRSLYAIPSGNPATAHFSDGLSAIGTTGFKNCHVSRRDTPSSYWNLGLIAQKYVDTGITNRGEILDKPPNTDIVACNEDSTRRRSILYVVGTTILAGYYVRLGNQASERRWKSVKWITGRNTLEEGPEDIREYAEQANYRTWGRSVIPSDSGYLGLAPKETKLGDVIAILGLSTPAILREQGDGTYQWI